tara:strand:+ start:612 stop:1244 length:633 start_codon:yes stop_codon:yes gene_type:complete
MSDKYVKPITRQDCAPYIIGIHYAKRFPSVSFAFGLFDNSDNLIGVATFGTPASAPLRRGLCGDDYAGSVLELNRVCLKYNRKNEASFLVSRALKMLGGDRVIVSFSDISKGHLGVIYQACNFIYCGLSAKRTDWKVRGKEHLHGQTIADEFRGVKNRAQAMRDKYGDDFYLEPRSRKHRYVIIKGSRGFVARAKRSLKYEILPYPKENT